MSNVCIDKIKRYIKKDDSSEWNISNQFEEEGEKPKAFEIHTGDKRDFKR